MLASVLHSEIAVKVSIQIMRTFVALRHLYANNAALFDRLSSIELRQLDYERKTDERFDEVFAFIGEREEPRQKIFFDGQIYDAHSYAMEEINIGTLDHDSTFFDMMGKPEIKLAFFKAYVEHMRRKHPDFGTACYVDSTPLPNDVHNNPFNAFSSHGTSGEANQTRLVLVLDSASGRPVWFEFIHGNKLDHLTIETVRNELKVNLDTDIHDLVLDAGYACENLFEHYNANNHYVTDESGNRYTRTMVIRMPEKKRVSAWRSV